MKLKKLLTLGCLVALVTASNVTYGGTIFPVTIIPESESTAIQDPSTITSSDVTDDDIKAQLYRATSAVEAEEKAAMLKKFNAMSPQERYDFILPGYLEELRMLYAQMKMMEEEIMSKRGLEEFAIDHFINDIQKFKQSLDKFASVGQIEYSTTINLYNAADELESMSEKLQFISLFVKGYNPEDVGLTKRYKDEYDLHDKGHMDYYTIAFEFSLMREFDIVVDESVDRTLEESILTHHKNVEMLQSSLDDVVECGESYAKGKQNSDLYVKTGDAESLYLNLRTDNAVSSFGGEAAEHPVLTPLAYEAINKIEIAAEKTKYFTMYYKSDSKKEKKSDMEDAQTEAIIALKNFEDKCEELLVTAEEIDSNILRNVADAKAKRKEIAAQYGHNSWFEYQLALEAEEKAARDAKIVDTATDLAVERKVREEEEKLRRQAAYEQKMRERIDFSKSLSQQTYTKQFYLEKSQFKLEQAFGNDSGWVSLGLTMDSQAFDELFRLRANGADIIMMQQLFDQNPFEFATILRLYKAYQ